MNNQIDNYTNFLKSFGFIPPFIGGNYSKYRLLIIGQNRLGDDGHNGHDYGEYGSHADFNQIYLQKFLNDKISNNVLKKPFELLSKILNINKGELINYIAFTNLVKTPSISGTEISELARLFDKEHKYDKKNLISYEIEEILKPNIILVLGKQTMNLFFDKITEIEEDNQLNYLLYYKNIPLFEFYHVSHNWWDRKENKLNEKIKKIAEKLGIEKIE